MTPLNALVFLAILLGLGLGILLQLNTAAKILGVCSLIPVALYPLAKRVTWWPQIVLGVTFGWAAPEGFAAATGTLGWPALTIYLAAITWILGYDTIYAHQDREDDALIGVKSTARLLGARTRPFLAGCYTATILLVAVSMVMTKAAWFGFPVLALAAMLLARQVAALDIDDPAKCLNLFKSNREAGLAIACAIIAGQV